MIGMKSVISMSEQDSYIYGTVKVGVRGQIVIPSKARKELNIKSGDLLLVMAGKNRRGLALVKAEMMREFANRIIQGLQDTKQESE
jgi:AbrB family looped-hinge helix DNA binding protein